MSRSTPPNSSSKNRAAITDPPTISKLQPDATASVRALVGRLAEELGADPEAVSRVASTLGEIHARAPDLFVPAAGGLAPAFATMAASDGADTEAVYAALGAWALASEGEPIEHMRRECLHFENAMTRGALRLYAAEPERCAESLIALQRFTFLQLALLASLSARSPEPGGAAGAVSTPEYAAFMKILRSRIETHRKNGIQLALLLLQIEKLEQVDRLLGLQSGEELMSHVTRRMRERVLRKQDKLGRVSRDQLACLLPHIAGEGVAILAANKILEVLEAPIPLGERLFAPDAAIGIAIYPAHGEDPQTLMRNSTLAAGAARATADRAVVYDPQHSATEERKDRYEARLRHALEENELGLVFTPQLDLKSGRIGGLDCVLLWEDAELGKVPDTRAMEAAERSGLSREVTRWIFDNALRQSAEFARAGLECSLGVKVTASALLQPDFPEFVGRALRTWEVPPKRLVIEVHETAIAGALEQVKATFARLKLHGLRLAIDGFGTGSSSMGNLAELPFDEMKISATFTRDMRHEGTHLKIVRSLAQVARTLGLHMTAEGVEEAETALALSSIGCERVQGAYVSAPLTAQEILRLEESGSGLTTLRLSDV